MHNVITVSFISASVSLHFTMYRCVWMGDYP